MFSAMGFSNNTVIDEIPSLEGKIALVTGGNTGIGLITCEELSAKGAKVYLAARSPERANAAIQQIKSKQPEAKIEFLPFDMTSIHSARKAAQTVIDNEKRLDIVGKSIRFYSLPRHDSTRPKRLVHSLGECAQPLPHDHSRQRWSHGIPLQARQRRRSPIRQSSNEILPFVVSFRISRYGITSSAFLTWSLTVESSWALRPHSASPTTHHRNVEEAPGIVGENRQRRLAWTQVHART